MVRLSRKPRSPGIKGLKHTHEKRPNEICKACEASTSNAIPGRAYDDLIRTGHRPSA